jgi:integrase
MSSIQQTTKGYRVQVAVKGQRDSATFPSKREAQQWGVKREIEMQTTAAGVTSTKTLRDAFRRYGEEVSPNRRGWRWEHLRLAAFERSSLPCKLRLSAITPEHIAAWRDDRLREVSAGTVLREITLLSAVFEVARREWRWLEANPVKIIRKPSKPAHRERLISWREIKGMLRALEHHPRAPAVSVTQSIALCFLAALRTGMRAGELAGLPWSHYRGHYVRLDKTKNGSARDVPLSLKARRVFERARGFDPVLCFGVSSQSLDVLFRRARGRAGLDGFTFHDSRHVAATWIGRSGKLEMLEMCKMFGWRDPRHALIYFNPTVSDLAQKLG